MSHSTFAHAGICVSDIERACSWYNLYFGFTLTRRFEKPSLEIKGAVLSLGNVTLEILEPYNPKPVPVITGSLAVHLRNLGSNHIAIGVSDVAELFNRMKSDNVKLITDLIDNKFFFCKDPDDTLIEIKSNQ